MRAILVNAAGSAPLVGEAPEPECPDHAVIVQIAATGLCRSDWHAWQGHDSSVSFPHVPGHEFVGVIVHVGNGVAAWRLGERVTAPFVNACGACQTCAQGRQSICPRQTQPGFDRPGSFAERVVVFHADTNLVAVPLAIDDATAAGLGCRFATAYRAVSNRARVSRDDQVVVLGCGGVGLAAIIVAVARGARVVAVDLSTAALERAGSLGAQTLVRAGGEEVAARIREVTGGGAHVVIEALGAASLLRQGLALLRPGGRHVQVGLLVGPESTPTVDVGRIIAWELELLGSHGMSAHEYPAMLDEIARGALDPSALVGRTISFEEGPDALAEMSRPPQSAGMTVIRF